MKPRTGTRTYCQRCDRYWYRRDRVDATDCTFPHCPMRKLEYCIVHGRYYWRIGPLSRCPDCETMPVDDETDDTTHNDPRHDPSNLNPRRPA